jgi:hypothetical protein
MNNGNFSLIEAEYKLTKFSTPYFLHTGTITNYWELFLDNAWRS